MGRQTGHSIPCWEWGYHGSLSWSMLMGRIRPAPCASLPPVGFLASPRDTWHRTPSNTRGPSRDPGQIHPILREGCPSLPPRTSCVQPCWRSSRLYSCCVVLSLRMSARSSASSFSSPLGRVYLFPCVWYRSWYFCLRRGRCLESLLALTQEDLTSCPMRHLHLD